jgi:hypothetical protein
MFRNQFKNIWDKELFHLVREFFTKRIHHFNGNINDETTVLEFRYKDETRIYDVQENSQAA